MKRVRERKGDEGRSYAKREKYSAETVEENQKLHVLAQRSALGKTLQLFNRLKSEGIANEYSYTILLNAYVRCGSIKAARNILRQIKALPVTPSVVTYTALLKGYCTGVQDRTKQARALLEEMEGNAKRVDAELKLKKARRLLPNHRTVTTFLRGCLRFGLLEDAKKVVLKGYRVWRIDVDSSSYEYLVMLHCQVKKVQSVDSMIAHFQKQCALDIVHSYQLAKTGDIPKSVADAVDQLISTCFMLHTMLAKACSVLGEWKQCKRSLKAGQELRKAAVSEGKIRELLQVSKKDRRKRAKMKASARETLTLNAVPIKFAAHEGKAGDDRNRKVSNNAFRSHLKEVHLKENERVTRFVSSQESFDKKGSLGVVDRYINACSRTLVFLSMNRKNITHSLMSCLLKRFGLTAAFNRKTELVLGKSSKAEVQSKAQEYAADMRKIIAAHFNGEQLNLRHLFGNESNGAEGNRPIYLEVASGRGDFALAHAMHDKDKANWIALELRADRVCNLLSNQCYSDVNNLANMCGDAKQILRDHFPEEQMEGVYVNHPEPPQQVGNELESGGSHLLTPTFMLLLHKVLAPGGTVTIVSDNEWYAKLLTKLFGESEVKEKFRGNNLGKSGFQHLFTTNGIGAWEGEPNSSIGHRVHVSTYFDKLWKSGVVANRNSRGAQAKRRFILQLQK